MSAPRQALLVCTLAALFGWLHEHAQAQQEEGTSEQVRRWCACMPARVRCVSATACMILILKKNPPPPMGCQLEFCFMHIPYGEQRVSYQSACRPIPPLPVHPVHLAHAWTDLHGVCTDETERGRCTPSQDIQVWKQVSKARADPVGIHPVMLLHCAAAPPPHMQRYRLALIKGESAFLPQNALQAPVQRIARPDSPSEMRPTVSSFIGGSWGPVVPFCRVGFLRDALSSAEMGGGRARSTTRHCLGAFPTN
jgi:hypothetical protein